MFDNLPRGFSWQVPCDTGLLTDVLLCSPTYYPIHDFSYDVWKERFGFTCTITHERLLNIHEELVDILVSEGVHCHKLTPDPDCPFQVFTRDAAIVSPWGPILANFASAKRYRERDMIKKYYEEASKNRLIEDVHDPLQNGTLEGGDVHIIRPGWVIIGINNRRTSTTGAEEFASLFRNHGWEVQFEYFSTQIAHLDMAFSMATEGIAVVYKKHVNDSLIRFLREHQVQVIYANEDEGETLGCNLLSLGKDRVISAQHAEDMNQKLRAEGIHVITMDLSPFAADGGSVRCLTQPLRREI